MGGRIVRNFTKFPKFLSHYSLHVQWSIFDKNLYRKMQSSKSYFLVLAMHTGQKLARPEFSTLSISFASQIEFREPTRLGLWEKILTLFCEGLRPPHPPLVGLRPPGRCGSGLQAQNQGQDWKIIWTNSTKYECSQYVLFFQIIFQNF